MQRNKNEKTKSYKTDNESVDSYLFKALVSSEYNSFVFNEVTMKLSFTVLLCIVAYITCTDTNARTDQYPSVKLENIGGIAQKNEVWCGPAVTEAVLRYFGLTSANSRVRTQNNQQFQQELSQKMRTTPQGTTPDNLLRVINEYFAANQLNGGRQYTLAPLNIRYNDYKGFYQTIHASLRYNMPVIFAYRGSRGNKHFFNSIQFTYHDKMIVPISKPKI